MDLTSTFLPEDVARLLTSGHWSITGSNMFIREACGLDKGVPVDHVRIKNAVVENKQLILRADDYTFVFPIEETKIDQPSSRVITIGLIKKVPEQQRKSKGGKVLMVPKIGKTVTLERL